MMWAIKYPAPKRSCKENKSSRKTSLCESFPCSVHGGLADYWGLRFARVDLRLSPPLGLFAYGTGRPLSLGPFHKSTFNHTRKIRRQKACGERCETRSSWESSACCTPRSSCASYSITCEHLRGVALLGGEKLIDRATNGPNPNLSRLVFRRSLRPGPLVQF